MSPETPGRTASKPPRHIAVTFRKTWVMLGGASCFPMHPHDVSGTADRIAFTSTPANRPYMQASATAPPEGRKRAVLPTTTSAQPKARTPKPPKGNPSSRVALRRGVGSWSFTRPLATSNPAATKNGTARVSTTAEPGSVLGTQTPYDQRRTTTLSRSHLPCGRGIHPRPRRVKRPGRGGPKASGRVPSRSQAVHVRASGLPHPARRRSGRTFQAMGFIALLALKARWATGRCRPTK